MRSRSPTCDAVPVWWRACKHPAHAAEHHRGEQSDLTGSQDEGSLGRPNLQTLLSQVRLIDRLRTDAGRFRQHAEMPQLRRDLHHVFGIVHEHLGHVTVTEIDATLVVGLFAGDVVPSDLVIDRTTRSADGTRDQIARLEFRDLRTDFEHLPEALVPDDKVFAAGRSVAVESLVDLAISRIDADLQRLHQDRAALGNRADMRVRLIVQLGLRDLSQMNTVGLSGKNGDGFHGVTTR